MKPFLSIVSLLLFTACAALKPMPKGEEFYLSGESTHLYPDGKTEMSRVPTLIKRIDLNKGEAYYEWLFLAPDASGKMATYDSLAKRIGATQSYVVTTSDDTVVGRLNFSDETHNTWTAELFSKAGHSIVVKGEKKGGVVTEEKKFIKFNGDYWFTIKTKFSPVTKQEFEEKLKAFKHPKG